MSKVCRLHLAAWLKQELTQVLYESLSCPHTGSYSGQLKCWQTVKKNFVFVLLLLYLFLYTYGPEGRHMSEEWLFCPLQEAKACKSGGHQWGPEGHVRPDIIGRTASAKLTQNHWCRLGLFQWLDQSQVMCLTALHECACVSWAAQYTSWLLIELTQKAVVFSFLLLSVLVCWLAAANHLISIPCGAFCRNPVTGRDTGVTGGFATSCGTSLALTGNVSISITFISGSLTAVLDTLGMHCLCVWVIWMMSSVLYSVTYVWWKHVCNAADENLLHAWLLRLCSHMTLCCHISHDCCI